MLSPSSWIKRAGVGGALAPFFKCVCVYFLLDTGASAPSAARAACKCAPVLCLLAATLYRAATLPPPHTHRRRYAVLISLGLLMSVLGDALLVWPARLEAGMAAFGAAHAAYVAALGWRPAAPRVALACYGGAALYLVLVPAPAHLRVPAALYAALLATTAWRGVTRGGPACVGALLFLLSDAVLSYTMFAAPLPYSQEVVMSTYYAAQLGLAYSALQPPPHPPRARTHTRSKRVNTNTHTHTHTDCRHGLV